MAKRRTIKIRGLRGKRFTRFPFFSNENVKKEIRDSKFTRKIKLVRKNRTDKT